jgi:UPF0176 protein
MITVAALYCFAPLANPAAVRTTLEALCKAEGLRGTILLAPEGINGTIAGEQAAVETVLAHIRALPGCAHVEIKLSTASTMPFHRLKVRTKAEIVTMGAPGLNPADVGTHIDPADWNALIADPETIVIDTRNDYEVAVGTFAGALNPNTKSFRDFPAWFAQNRDTLLGGHNNPKVAPKVAMFCTGGIRCEKATAFLKSEGIDQVFHLQGGILKYLESVPRAESLWQGECFVFDERVSLGHGLQPGTHSLCRACRMPVSPADMNSPDYVPGVACPACAPARTKAQRAGYAERHRQTSLAAARGQTHIGRNSDDD